MIVGLLHPGEMGAAVGRVLQGNGHEVIWASEGRSEETRSRAASFRDVSTVAALADDAELILSICPPHAAVEVATSVEGFDGVYVDANAISPMRAQEIAALHPRFVDGAIIGGPDDPQLYLSEDVLPNAGVVRNPSALKMAYAAWSKGSAAMLLAIRDVARHFGVEQEWERSAPELAKRLPRAEHAAATKGWRWTGEMEEIADTFAAAGQPDGFHRAAARVYRS